MDAAEIRAEMARRPDAHLLVEWIEEHADDAADVRSAINAYFAALED